MDRYGSHPEIDRLLQQLSNELIFHALIPIIVTVPVLFILITVLIKEKKRSARLYLEFSCTLCIAFASILAVIAFDDLSLARLIRSKDYNYKIFQCEFTHRMRPDKYQLTADDGTVMQLNSPEFPLKEGTDYIYFDNYGLIGYINGGLEYHDAGDKILRFISSHLSQLPSHSLFS